MTKTPNRTKSQSGEVSLVTAVAKNECEHTRVYYTLIYIYQDGITAVGAGGRSFNEVANAEIRGFGGGWGVARSINYGHRGNLRDAQTGHTSLPANYDGRGPFCMHMRAGTPPKPVRASWCA